MSNYYNLDGIKTELKKRMERAQAEKEAWEKVTFPTKKNGEPFAVLGRNIDGATLYVESWAMQPGENKLRVSCWSKSYGWVTDEIYCYCHVSDLDEEDPRKDKAANYMPKQTYLVQVYRFDLDDIKAAVQARIQQRAKDIEEYAVEIERADAAFRIYREAFQAAEDALLEACDFGKLATLRYMVRDTVKERYPYC